ncbi:uncharacterized protein A4U43_C01F24470 [Asparagus officinalis]|uniref:Uncharacterized protein n=1 Tax=Asparagus officinalis TaxID=4686 RepID=A0A5P1FS31_ASPOF|nr:uncharacterized protein A4U43_C01F24470 [Asparagus officinalis]
MSARFLLAEVRSRSALGSPRPPMLRDGLDLGLLGSGEEAEVVEEGLRLELGEEAANEGGEVVAVRDGGGERSRRRSRRHRRLRAEVGRERDRESGRGGGKVKIKGRIEREKFGKWA